MASTSETSITRTAALEFVRSANVHSELSCLNIKGFYLRKTANKATWYLRYTDFEGKRRKLNLGPFINGSKDRSEAATKAIEYRIALKAGADPYDTIAHAKKAYVRNAQTRTNRILRNYLYGPYRTAQLTKANNGQHTINIIGSAFSKFLDCEMDKLEAKDVEQWVNSYGVKSRNKSGNPETYKSTSTLERAYGALKTMLRKAIKQDVIDRSPLLDISINEILPRHVEKLSRTNSNKRRILSDTELDKVQLGLRLYGQMIVKQRKNSREHGKPYLPDLSEVTYPHWFIPFIQTALHTGMRPGDIYNLQWSHIDLENAVIRFTPQKTKHHSSPPEVALPLTHGLLMVLKKWKQQCNPKSEISFVFINPETQTRYGKDAHKKPWAKVRALGNLDPETDFYTFRHHFISHLVTSGIPLFTVAKLVGHKSIKMIEKHYGHLCQREAKTAIELINSTIKLLNMN